MKCLIEFSKKTIYNIDTILKSISSQNLKHNKVSEKPVKLIIYAGLNKLVFDECNYRNNQKFSACFSIKKLTIKGQVNKAYDIKDKIEIQIKTSMLIDIFRDIKYNAADFKLLISDLDNTNNNFITEENSEDENKNSYGVVYSLYGFNEEKHFNKNELYIADFDPNSYIERYSFKVVMFKFFNNENNDIESTELKNLLNKRYLLSSNTSFNIKFTSNFFQIFGDRLNKLKYCYLYLSKKYSVLYFKPEHLNDDEFQEEISRLNLKLAFTYIDSKNFIEVDYNKIKNTINELNKLVFKNKSDIDDNDDDNDNRIEEDSIININLVDDSYYLNIRIPFDSILYKLNALKIFKDKFNTKTELGKENNLKDYLINSSFLKLNLIERIGNQGFLGNFLFCSEGELLNHGYLSKNGNINDNKKNVTLFSDNQYENSTNNDDDLSVNGTIIVLSQQIDLDDYFDEISRNNKKLRNQNSYNNPLNIGNEKNIDNKHLGNDALLIINQRFQNKERKITDNNKKEIEDSHYYIKNEDLNSKYSEGLISMDDRTILIESKKMKKLSKEKLIKQEVLRFQMN